jgi:hypothetical protein
LCKQTLKAGAMSYAFSPSIADAMWKVENDFILFFFVFFLFCACSLTLHNPVLFSFHNPVLFHFTILIVTQTLTVLPVPQVLPVRVTTKLPNSLLEVMQNHGEGNYPV